MAVRGIDHDHVDPGLPQRGHASQGIGRRAHGRTDAQAPDAVLAGVRKLGGLLEILDGDHALQFMIAGHHQHLLDAMLVQQREHLFLGRVLAHGDQALLGGHHRGHGSVEFGFETQVAMRHDAHDFRAEHHRHAGDVLRPRELDDLANGHVRFDADRIADDAALELLDAVDLPRLILDRHVLVNDADTALLSDGDRQAGLGNGIHGGGDHRQIDSNFAG